MVVLIVLWYMTVCNICMGLSCISPPCLQLPVDHTDAPTTTTTDAATDDDDNNKSITVTSTPPSLSEAWLQVLFLVILIICGV